RAKLVQVNQVVAIAHSGDVQWFNSFHRTCTDKDGSRSLHRYKIATLICLTKGFQGALRRGVIYDLNEAPAASIVCRYEFKHLEFSNRGRFLDGSKFTDEAVTVVKLEDTSKTSLHNNNLSRIVVCKCTVSGHQLLRNDTVSGLCHLTVFSEPR